MKVLVVDDNPIVRAGLSAVLGRMADVSEIFEAEFEKEADENKRLK